MVQIFAVKGKRAVDGACLAAQAIVVDLQRRPAEGAQIEQSPQVRLRLGEEPGPSRQPTIPFPPFTFSPAAAVFSCALW